MKPRLTNSILALCALTFAPVITSAQENNPPKPPPGSGPRRDQQRDERGPRDQFKQAEMRPTPFIGVITREMAAEVRAQAGVREGFGLLVIDVMPDGPAKAAGLQEHDVLVMLDDQKLVNMEQLSALVRAQKKGDEITLTIKRAGAEQKIKVTVGERDMPPPMPQMERYRYDAQPPFGEDWRERADRFQNQMREYQDRVQDWTRGDRNRPMPPPPPQQQKDGPGREGFRRPPAEDRKSGTSTQSSTSTSTSITEDGGEKVTMHGSVMRRDDTGVYSLTRQNDKTTFTARDKDGKEQSWPVNTPQEREAVPAELRDKLRELEKIQIDSKAEIRRGEAAGK